MRKLLCSALFIVFFSPCFAVVKGIISPDHKLNIEVVTPTGNQGGPVYFSINYNRNRLLSFIKLGLETDRQIFSDRLRLLSVSNEKLHKDDYMMITGKRSHCINTANERTFRFENDEKQVIEVTFRVYNDGVAFQYRIKGAAQTENVTNELTTYSIPEGTKRWIQHYTPGYEDFYPLATNGNADNKEQKGGQWGYPALIEPQDSLFVLITEANMLRGHCGSMLNNSKNLNEYQVQMADKKLPFNGSWKSPWRLLIVGSLPKLVESTLVTDVSDPSVTQDTSWIKPGPVAWIYWANNHGSKDFKIVKDYIDLAANMKWPYNLIDWEWDVMNNGGNVQDAIKYSLSKGVKPLLWYNSSTSWAGVGAPGPLNRLNSKTNREKEYKWLSGMGVAGIKIDFFPGDGVAAMDYYIDLLEDAAKYKLMLNFHGATIPRGWQRTYPYMMSMEAVYGAEWYNNNNVLTDRAAEHNATLPFTRNIVGPMDYTSGTFSDSQHPHITSYAHELALPVIFESALQHMPDKPSVYYSLPDPVKKVLSELPTAWDDTKLLAGYPGVEVIVARRKGAVWYLAGINGTNEPKILSFSLNKLPFLGRNVTLIKDGTEGGSFNIDENVTLQDNNKKMQVACLARGGFLAVIR